MYIRDDALLLPPPSTKNNGLYMRPARTLVPIEQQVLHANEDVQCLPTHTDLVRDHFICPKSMTRQQALQKAQQARAAQMVLRFHEQYPALGSRDAVADLDKAEMNVLRCKWLFRKLPEEWDHLSASHENAIDVRDIESVAWYPPDGARPLYTPQQVQAAKNLVYRHNQLSFQFELFQELGLKDVASWNNLSLVQRGRIQAMASSDWARVYAENLFQSEKAAKVEADRKKRQWDESRGPRSFDRSKCPKDAMLQQNLREARLTRVAQNLLRNQQSRWFTERWEYNLNLLRSSKKFKKFPDKWDTLSDIQVSQIRSVAWYWLGAENPAYTARQVQAAKLLWSEYEALKVRQGYFEELGIKNISFWSELSSAGQRMIEAMAEGEWARVYEGNRFQWEKDALQDGQGKGKQQQMEKTPRPRHRQEESVRVKRRSELARMQACV
ncbi:hypothetical protein BC830DRAFT_908879 [Chytriomyces sp. MP71]|nr:hypothetical protein BC830DRAFT_908879 [Chytriomyces sp. MP71]